ncbi:MAG: S1C family serine protease [Bacteroidota bacterium]
MNAFLIQVYILLSALFITFSGISQKLTVNLTNGDSKFYFDGKYIGAGTKVIMDQEIDKNILNHQIKVTTPGYLDAYYAISGNKQNQFKEEYTFLNTEILPQKKESDNYFFFGRVYDLKVVLDQEIYVSKIEENLEDSYSNAEKKGNKSRVQLRSSDTFGNPQIGLHEEAINEVLKDEKYLDSSDVLVSFQNKLLLEARMTGLKQYYFSKSPINAEMAHYKLKSLWYIKNVYGEFLDSGEVEVTLGDFANNYFTDCYFFNMPIILKRSLVEFQKTELFQKYQNLDLAHSDSKPLLHITKPANVVQKLEDAEKASVIIKINDQGHGSGFAISNDGFILTNYHVICSDKVGETADFVVLFNGKEYEAEVVRTDKVNDIALLKIDAFFDKAFALGSEKKYKIYDETYTIGAPTSIELGQTMTKGLISNDRMLGGRNILQLSMGVNFGNSGGPLFDKEGTLHGVIVSKIVGASAEGLAFAIPTFQISKNLNLVIE